MSVRALQRLSVECGVGECHILGTNNGIYFFIGDTVEMTIVQRYILHANMVVQSVYPDAVAALLTGDVL